MYARLEHDSQQLLLSRGANALSLGKLEMLGGEIVCKWCDRQVLWRPFEGDGTGLLFFGTFETPEQRSPGGFQGNTRGASSPVRLA